MSKRKSSHDQPPRSFFKFMMAPRVSRSSSSSHILIAFYDGSGTDDFGRSLSEILRWDVHRLEGHHNYIQTLFPLPEGSDFNWNAPLINRRVFEAFRERHELRDRLEEAFKRMLWFYGLEHQVDEDGVVEVIEGFNYNDRAPRSWNKAIDHNHMRITRIIRSLRLLGLEEHALAFYNALVKFDDSVRDSSLEFWRRAAKRSLNIRPDIEVEDEQDDRIGPKFLRDFVRSQKDCKGNEESNDKDLGTLNS